MLRDVARLTRSFSAPLPWSQVAGRTAKEIDRDDCLGLAAQLGFYFFLSLFPALLVVVAIIGSLPLERALAEMTAALGTVAPRDALVILRTQIDALRSADHGSVLTIGIAGALWSSSAAMVAIIDALNAAYDVDERRPWWRRRLVAIVLTATLALFIVMSLTFVLVGPTVAATAAGWFGLGPAITITSAIVRWPLMIGLVTFGVDLVYYFAPNRTTMWTWLTPGALLATGLWLLGSFAFKFYVANLANLNATYGAIGSVVVLLLWFYVCGLSILVGAELNGVIEQARREGRGATLGQRLD